MKYDTQRIQQERRQIHIKGQTISRKEKLEEGGGGAQKKKGIVLSAQDEKRFWSFVRKDDSCWNWTGGKIRGYGNFWLLGKTKKSHRISYLMHNGPIPDGLLVCHSCDNPSCVNPDHLFVGTVQDNSDDMKKKGRQATGDKVWSHAKPWLVRRGDNHPFRLNPNLPAKGERCSRAKLTSSVVLDIRKLKGSGISAYEIAKKFNVTEGTIYHIWRRLTWKHI